ncbi:MAG: DUF2807 domain-containing protein [Psychroflexus maritimus]
MKLKIKFRLLLLVTLIGFSLSCNDFEDCFASQGNEETSEFELGFYDKIVLREHISLEIIDSENEFVEITAGSRRMDDVEVYVQDSTLYLEATGLCTAGFSEAQIKAVVSTEKLREIRNSSQFSIKSRNTLTYPRLALLSNVNHPGPTINVGDFDLRIDNSYVWVSSTGNSIFNLQGRTENFSFGNYSSTGRINAQLLKTDTVSVDHRGYSNVHVSPKNHIKGRLRSTGNVILHRIPQTIDVEETYTGKLLIAEDTDE